MPMADWIDRYPQVKALLAADDDVLDYTPDGGDPLAALHAVVASIAALGREIRANERAGIWGPQGLPLPRVYDIEALLQRTDRAVPPTDPLRGQRSPRETRPPEIELDDPDIFG